MFSSRRKPRTGRKIEEYEKLEKMKTQGRVYTGAEGTANLVLVDELGTLDQAIAYAKKAAGIDADAKLERLDLPKPTSPFEALFGPIDPTAPSAGHSLAQNG